MDFQSEEPHIEPIIVDLYLQSVVYICYFRCLILASFPVIEISNKATVLSRSYTYVMLSCCRYVENYLYSRALLTFHMTGKLVSHRWWTSCVWTWTKSWRETRSCQSWTTGRTPCRPEPRSLRAAPPNSRTSTGGKTARWAQNIGFMKPIVCLWIWYCVRMSKTLLF